MMKPLISLYLRLFLFMGIPFGLLTLLIDIILGEGFDLNKFLFRVIFFGGTMSATLVTIHVSRLKSQGVKSLTSDNLSVKQKRRVESNMSLQNLIDLLRHDPLMGNMKQKEINYGIILQSKVSWRSWGEKITIATYPKNNINEYEILSEPRISTTIVDYGKNFENVTRIEKLLKNSIEG